MSKLESLSEAGSVMLIALKAIKPSYRLGLFAGTSHTRTHTNTQSNKKFSVFMFVAVRWVGM